MLRWLTAGESHGPKLVAVLDGIPAGVELTTADVEAALARRRAGYGRGARMKFEQDEVTLIGGVRHGVTMGSPIAIEIGNTEWPKWQQVMAADPVAALNSEANLDAGRGDELEIARNRPLTRPRPGHADLTAMRKFGFNETRPALERASARETAARVALGTVAAAFLRQVAGIELLSHVVQIGTVRVTDPEVAQLRQGSRSMSEPNLPSPQLGFDLAAAKQHLEQDPVRCFHPETSAAMVTEIDAAQQAGDTLGGVVEVIAYHVPPGLGSYSQGDTRLEAALACEVMGIQAVKGVEIGDGFASAARLGSQAHDEIFRDDDGRLARFSNRAGGIEGGMSNGAPLRVTAAFKPISTVPKALRTIDTLTGAPAVANHQRSDVTAVVPGAVVVETMVALVLARAILEKFGGDSVAETRRNLQSYLASFPENLQ